MSQPSSHDQQPAGIAALEDILAHLKRHFLVMSKLLWLPALAFGGIQLWAYTRVNQIPYPRFGAGLESLVFLIAGFLLIVGGLLATLYIAPALLASVVDEPTKGQGAFRVSEMKLGAFLKWAAPPAITGWVVLLVVSQYPHSNNVWHAFWLILIVATLATFRSIPAEGALLNRLLICAAYSFLSLAWLWIGAIHLVWHRQHLHLLEPLPEAGQWAALLALTLAYIVIVYIQVRFQARVRRSGIEVVTVFAFTMMMLGCMLAIAQPDLMAAQTSKLLARMNRGGGEQVEIIVSDAAVAMPTEGCTPHGAGTIRCNAKLMLDFGDEVSIRLGTESQVWTLNSSDVRLIIRNSPPTQPEGEVRTDSDQPAPLG
ncbi:hypothetical protein [Stenotrophomonas sp. CC120223-11]|uniref:hypothetical protein n=1 Tax=Stenotrophomonas sp. CC120223-11 TaxID=1378090 RepID=UPI000BDA1DAA|nr:hypothetical protein [Stenotrophomonas sp. CC120223-11]SNY69505.1 hypothetical protein SAMN02744784_02516 [Stenotrophomonas sp. CC120223-11]